jgi:serine/threonine protein kinase
MQAIRTDLGGGRFRIKRPLGEGGMGVVYEAFDEVRKARVALKAMQRIEPTALYRFKKEFRALADVIHPNLVALHELFSDAAGAFFTMELVDGTDLLSYVRGERGEDDEAMEMADTVNVDVRTVSWRNGPPSSRATRFDERRLRAAFRQLAEGVGALHAAGKLHRDLKPSNVMVAADGRVVILDFGLIASAQPDQQTVDHGVSGTPAYMPPEQAASAELTEASDWYAFGAMLFEALTGRLPFEGPVMKLLVDKQEHEAPRPSSVAAGIPSDLDELCAGLLRRDPLERPSSSEIFSRLGALTAPRARNQSGEQKVLDRSSPQVFVGRERQLLALRDAFRASRQGRTVVQLVSGATGLGKTQLVERFVAELESRGAMVLRGRCFEHESVPYKALDAAMDALSVALRRMPRSEVEALLPIGVHALARIFPVLPRVSAIAEAKQRGAEPTDPIELRRRAARALRALLDRATDRKAVVLWIDDLQWGDADSAAVLAELVRPPDAPPLLIVGSFRSEEAQGPFMAGLQVAFAECRPALDLRHLDVGPLGRTESCELTAALLGCEGNFTPLVKRIVKETDGSPFLIEQLVGHLQQSPDPTATMGRSLRLDDVLRARIESLDDDARALLEVVAIAGQPIARELACKAARLQGERGIVAQATLRAGRWVRSHRVGEGHDLECYHGRLRSAVVAVTTPARLAEVHGALADGLSEQGGVDPERLSLHYLGAGDEARAGALAAVAAERATAALAFSRAATLWRQALELQHLEGEAARVVRCQLAGALSKAGHAHDAALAYLEAAQGAGEAESLELRRLAAENLLGSGHVGQGLVTFEEVLGAIGMRLTLGTWVVLWSLLLESLRLRLRGLSFQPRDPRLQTADERTRLDVCWSVGGSLGLVYPALASAYQTRHLRLALAAGDRLRVGLGLAGYAIASAQAGSRATARTAARRARAEAVLAACDAPQARTWTEIARAFGAYLEGRFADALIASDAAIEIAREHALPAQWETASILMFNSWALFHVGAIAELSRRLPAYIHEARAQGNRYLLTNMRIGLANAMWLAAGSVERAEQELEEAMRDWGAPDGQIQQYYELVARAQQDLFRGRGLAALSRVEARWPALRRAFLFEVEVVAIEALHLRARAALAAFDETTDAKFLDLAERDARRLARWPAPWGRAVAALVLGAVQAARGDLRGAEQTLRRALQAFLELRMKLWAAAALRRIGELAGDEEGAERAREANAAARSEGVMDPSAWFRMLAPGFARVTPRSSVPPADAEAREGQ